MENVLLYKISDKCPLFIYNKISILMINFLNKVIMYADKITDSMQNAIVET